MQDNFFLSIWLLGCRADLGWAEWGSSCQEVSYQSQKPTSGPLSAFAKRQLNPMLVYINRKKCFFLPVSLIFIVSFDNCSGTRAWVLCCLVYLLYHLQLNNTYIHIPVHTEGNIPYFFHGDLHLVWFFTNTVARNVCMLVGLSFAVVPWKLTGRGDRRDCGWKRAWRAKRGVSWKAHMDIWRYFINTMFLNSLKQ